MKNTIHRQLIPAAARGDPAPASGYFYLFFGVGHPVNQVARIENGVIAARGGANGKTWDFMTSHEGTAEDPLTAEQGEHAAHHSFVLSEPVDIPAGGLGRADLPGQTARENRKILTIDGAPFAPNDPQNVAVLEIPADGDLGRSQTGKLTINGAERFLTVEITSAHEQLLSRREVSDRDGLQQNRIAAAFGDYAWREIENRNGADNDAKDQARRRAFCTASEKWEAEIASRCIKKLSAVATNIAQADELRAAAALLHDGVEARFVAEIQDAFHAAFPRDEGDSTCVVSDTVINEIFDPAGVEPGMRRAYESIENGAAFDYAHLSAAFVVRAHIIPAFTGSTLLEAKGRFQDWLDAQ